MLVLARKIGQSIVINDNVEVLVIEVRGDQVRLGIDAPRAIPVHRKELLEQIKAENVQASSINPEAVSKAIGELD
ncbi:carbon storage regulator CsrA [bacterium]|nr:carbon storage regulator CsrA [bacterium]